MKVEIVVTTTDAATNPKYEDVYRCHLSQMVENAAFTSRYVQGTPVRTVLPAAPFHTRTIVLESYYPVEPTRALWVRVQREPADPANSFTNPTGLAMVKVTPMDALAKPHVVQNVSGYNLWPMIQAIGEKLVCVYSRGTATRSVKTPARFTLAPPRTTEKRGRRRRLSPTRRTMARSPSGRGWIPRGHCSSGCVESDRSGTTTSTAPRMV